MTNWLKHLTKLSQEELEEAQSLKDNAVNLEHWLISRSLASSKEILIAKSSTYRLPCLSLVGYHPSSEALQLLTEDQARKLKALPLFLLKDRLFIAIAEANDLRCEDFIRKLTGKKVKPVLATSEDISQAITQNYLATQQRTVASSSPAREEENEDEEQNLADSLSDLQSPIIQATWKIIAGAIRLGASDIHLEPDANQAFLRYRIDGILHDYPPPDYTQYVAIIGRIKVMSAMDIAERRLPQDGRFSVELEKKVYDLRVSVLPNVHGEGVCIRILDPSSTRLELAQMGFEPETLKQYEKVINKPHGIVLVTGPTGSGKSTTLYATLNRIKSRERKLITVEDPVEYKVAGLMQIPIHPEIGFTFEAGLRAILRHDPDIIMLGEIRDLPSAEMAFRAALTGHLLFSTLHTNSAALAITRLVDMGIPAFQVLLALSGILAQRLIRKLCPECKQQVQLTKEELKSLGLPGKPQDYKVYQPSGCASCQGIGYRGRTAIYEFIEITAEIRRLSERELSGSNLEEIASLNGFRSLRQAALTKFAAGITSLDEVMAVTAES